MPKSDDLIMQPGGSIRFKRLRLGVVVVGALVIVAFAASSAFDAWRAYRNSLAATDREIDNVAKALAEQTTWTWRGIDLLLRDTARWYRTDSSKVAPEHLDEVLANRTAGVSQLRAITIIDAQGVQRHRSRGPSPPNLDLSDRSYFLAHRDGTVTGLFMSEPLLSRSEQRASIILSRRLEDDQHKFAGVITAIVDLEDLERFYGSVSLGSGSAIQLLRDNGTLLVRTPPAPEAIGKKFPELATPRTEPANQLVSPIDGRRDFIAVAPVRGTPLVVAVTRDETVALRSWRDEASRLASRTLVVTLLGLVAIAALWRQLRRVETGERALRDSEERYALAMEGANEGHWDWNLETDQLFLSSKMKSLEGHPDDPAMTTRAAWVAKTHVHPDDQAMTTRTAWVAKIHIHPDDRAHLEAALSDHLEGRTPSFEFEYRVEQSKGDWRWLLARGRCLRDAAGKPYRFVGSAMDVTAQRQAQAEKEHLEAQLRQSQKMEAIGTLAGGIAHDFNNILGAILGYGELAQEQAAEGSALRRYVDNVMHAAGRAKVLVDRILGFSRSGLGERVHVHVQSVIEETLELIAASLPSNIRLEKRLSAGDAALIGDSTHLHQVAMNLCTNAIHAMERGGTLTVLLDRTRLPGRVSLSRGTLSPGTYVRLTIKDTGPGIPPTALDRIFDPFFTTKDVGEGTGLGLSLVHGIVSDLGGAIDVDTAAGQGTSFEIWLPLAAEAGKPAVEPVRELPRGQGETVMIVDDEPMLVALAEEMLAELGYEPVGFDSSQTALKAFRAEPERFDLVLTDEAMPDLVGTELAREIRRIRPDVPIILMSGHGGVPLANRAADIGVNEVLHKPLQRGDLAESFARNLGRSVH